MTNKRVKKLDSSAAAKYIAKAREFAESMRRSAAAEEWDAAGLGAVHSVISAADALLAAYGGIRSIEPDHRMAIRLLEETLEEMRSLPLAAIFHSLLPRKMLLSMNSGG